jgi:pimeloyl-ACP methyl ester carboxylesterase
MRTGAGSGPAWSCWTGPRSTRTPGTPPPSRPARVPGATVVTAPTGHNVHEQDPVLLADTVLKFLGA